MSKINIEDPTTFNHKYAELECGVNYHYVEEGPVEGPVVVLLHGFPELWYVWKNQIVHLANLGFRVIVPDMIGYGQTKLTEKVDQLESFSFEFNCKAIHSLVYDKVLAGKPFEKIVVIGHDWGAATTWRFANNYPECLHLIITLSIPYLPPTPKFVELEKRIVAAPVLGYQAGLANGDVAKFDKNILKFLNVFWNRKPKNSNMHQVLAVPIGADFLDHVYSFDGELNEKFPGSDFLNYMVEQYSIQGTRGPTNWYRTSKINFDNDLKHAGAKVTLPSMTIIGKLDFTYAWVEVGKPFVTDNQLEVIENAGHWIQLSHPEFVNTKIEEYLRAKSTLFPTNKL